MLLSLLFLILILAIAFSQATRGFFSALIMTVLTVCCCAAAVTTHEWIAVNALAPYWQPDFAHPLALGVTFGLSLLLLSLAFKRLIRRSCLLPAWVDRAGGGVCGLITAEIMVGMIAVCVQMLPFPDGSILGYSRVARVSRDFPAGEQINPKSDAEDNELFFMPDRFAIATASLLSGGIFSGKRAFYPDNPDVVQAIGWVNAVPATVSRYAKPKSIAVVSTEPVQFVYLMIPGNEKEKKPATYEPMKEPKSGNELRMVRVQLTNAAKDERKTHTFTLRQFRVVGRMPGSDIYKQFAPIAIQQGDATQATNRHIRVIKERGSEWPVTDETYVPRGDDDQVEMVFELPKGFEPSYVEYKRGARAALSFDASAPGREPSGRSKQTEASPSPAPKGEKRPGGESPPSGTASAPSTTPSTGPKGSVPDSGRGGNIRRMTTQAGKSSFGDRMPMEMKSYRKLQNAEISRGALTDGHLVGEVDQQASGKDNAVTKFAVPDDKRLLQLNTGFLQAGSGLGRAISFAVGTAQNFFVTAEGGNPYQMVGKYAIAEVNGTKIIEVQYFSNQAGSIGGVGKFDKIKDDDLKGDYQLVLLFLVDPGARITSFSTGGDATRADDLKGENLVAPN
jgi:hypothetical protein